MAEITVVGGGIAGLVASITAAESGANVTLHEAHQTLGGRARTSEAPHAANEGPHALYADGPAWTWLVERDLVNAARLPVRALSKFRTRYDGRVRSRLPKGVLSGLRRTHRAAPVDEDFTTWLSRSHGAVVAHQVASIAGVITYDSDPGRLSAAFMAERLARASKLSYPAVRYVVGGWTSMIARMAVRARELGVRIESGSRVTEVPDRPTVVATHLDSARSLLGDESLRGESGRAVLLDVAMRSRRGDPFVIVDLDEAGFAERYSLADGSLVPDGESLVQVEMPLRPGESKGDGLARAEVFVDGAFPDWRERVTWRRDSVAAGRTGALDRPGFTWRDRPPIDRGGDVFLAGDQVAAPGLLSEVAFASGIEAGRMAALAAGVRAVAA